MSPTATTILSLRRRLLGLTAKAAFLAPALIRLTVGLVFINTGWGKLHTLSDVTELFTNLGIPMPAFNAVLASSTEFFGGILILVGLGARLVALPMAFTMLIAIITAQRENVDGLTALVGLQEWDYLIMFLVIALIGAGPLSLDAVITRRLARLDGDGDAPPKPDPQPAAATLGQT